MKEALHSIAGRLIIGSALLLPLFLGASGWYLERSHRQSLEAGQAERLQLQVFTLLAQAEYEGAIRLPRRLVETRYNQPNSGLYARITDAAGDTLWLSPSAVSLPEALASAAPPRLRPGQHLFRRQDGHYALSWQVLWETGAGEAVPLLFTVLESAAPTAADIAVYRRSLLFWLGGSALLLLGCQALILAWGLRPLRRLAGEVAAIEAGRADLLMMDYPREIRPLTTNLNTLLKGERQRRERVRNTLADLAHSLKTPLAVLRAADAAAPGYGELVGEQTRHMEQIVDYQLQRATGGSHRLLQRIPVPPLLQRLRESLLKVYADKSLDIELDVELSCRFRGDERDFLEVMGNLLDNACKYARQRVRVSAAAGSQGQLVLGVEDDGPGIPPVERANMLRRGARLDQFRPGQGIGLAVTADIVASYRGSLDIGEGALGGAKITISFP